ncbi:MAG: heme lyase CcmF/NrfE family subunit [Betaproteobacteria bacterium]|nr:heme lyase CcmF/NrfE family subunit [Betaproteobacteria bacterium]
MIIELAHFAAVLALLVAGVQALVPLVGAQTGSGQMMAVARPAAHLQFALLLLAWLGLSWGFVDNDFSLALAASHSNSALPLHYRLSAVWGNHEGSILLWTLILSGWGLAVSRRTRALDRETVARVLAVIGMIGAGLLLFTLAVSNPFLRLDTPVADGRDLNPLLQDPGMVFHPPVLYMGYVGLVVPFAFALAALMAGRLDTAWARWSRPWTAVAWCFLTCGIALGSFWAYYELGWGGWWFWDPVENASFMPWLVATALMHSLAVTEKRGAFRIWTALLAILAFSLSLLGTFIVRSGVLSSVHAFATDPARGVFILALLGAVSGGALALFAWRAPKAGLGAAFEPLSRESLLLANNLLLLVATASVLLGTLYPLAIEALQLGKLSVGPPYFEAVFVPLMAPALFLMAVAPLARWRRASLGDLTHALRWAFVVSVASACAAPLLLGTWTPMVGLGLFLAVWIAAGSLATFARQAHGGGWRHIGGAQAGMLLAHLGVAVFIAGVTVVGGFASEREVRLRPGDSIEVGGYRFQLQGLQQLQGPNYLAVAARVAIDDGGLPVAVLHPERRVYTASRMTMTEVAIDRSVWRDLYVAIGEPMGNDALSMRIHHKPLVNWIWGGCLIMGLGGLLAALDRRYRVPSVAAPRAHSATPPQRMARSAP